MVLMRISIDAMPLLVRSAGVKNYLFHWIAHLERVAPRDVRFDLFPWVGRPGALNHESSQVGALHTWSSLALFHFFNLPGNPAVNWVERGDVFHASKLLNPPRRPRLTATLYDLTCWSMPDFHTPANVRWEHRMAERVWKRADGLIAISEHTRDDAVQRLGLDPHRIRVIYPGVDRRYFDVTPAESMAVIARYGLSKRFILSVGTLEPRKNISLALGAWKSLYGAFQDQFCYVIAGPEGWGASETVRQLRENPPGVRYLGYVPEADLPGLIAGAALLFYPSLHEGFGFPVAQAMACGIPVLTSGVSALPEVAGGGALFADPLSVEDLRSNLERLLLSQALREKLGQAGRQRAARYRWEEAARQSMEFFREVADGKIA